MVLTLKHLNPIIRIIGYNAGRLFVADTDLMLKALADGTRQGILRVLAEHELTVSELVEVFELPQSTVSRQLKVLRDAGLLVDRRCAASVRYSAAPAGFNGGPGVAGHGPGQDLRRRLIEWLTARPIEPVCAERVRQVLRRRSGGDGFFDAVGGRWDQLRSQAFGRGFPFEALATLLPREWVVGDIGTGTGYLLGTLAALFREVIAIEPSAAMLEAARSRPELQGVGNLEFRQGSLDRLPAADGELDLAIASLVLHHVEDPGGALAELHRVVRPGGRLLIIEQEVHEHAAFRERMGDPGWGLEPALLAELVRRAGFRPAGVTPLRATRPAGGRPLAAPGLFAISAVRPGAESGSGPEMDGQGVPDE